MNVYKRQILRIFRLWNVLSLAIIFIVMYWLLSGNSTYKAIEILQVSFGDKKDCFVPKNVTKIDWHDYELIYKERKSVGIGEQGVPAELQKYYAKNEQSLYAINGFDGALSDRISLNRSLPDIRHPKCQKMRYIASLPNVSVIVPLYNEHWSTLLRTLTSVLNRSPKKLIKEIILVDDVSTKDFLKHKLDQYLGRHMPEVSVIRMKKRSGLIRARLAGAKKASSAVLVFLDSHVEVNVNWLPPLLEPVALNYRTVTCPFIDIIEYDTFEYRTLDAGGRGAFDWELNYKRLPLLPRDKEKLPEPYESPVMIGGIFAVSRQFFWELGGYDPEIDIWGGEQFEFSFKLWQCGGRMVDVPCSRVGHIYRKFAPFPNPRREDFLDRNYRRVAEVWMDEYAEFLYKRRPHYRSIDPGDLTEQKALREKLHCKSFRWFMKKIAFDLTAKYPTVEPKPFAEGQIRPESNKKLCVDAHHGDQNERLFLKPCSTRSKTEQEFKFSWHKEIRLKSRTMCWDLPEAAPRSPVLLYPCHMGGGNQLWRYVEETKKIIPGATEDSSCLDYSPELNELFINDCQSNLVTQRWSIDTLNHDMLVKWSDIRIWVTEPDNSYGT